MSGAMDLSVNDGDLTMRICALRVSPYRPFSPLTGRFVPTTGVAHTSGESQKNLLPATAPGCLTSVDDGDFCDRFGSTAASVGAGVFASQPASLTSLTSRSCFAGVAGDAGGAAFSSFAIVVTLGWNVTLFWSKEEGPFTSSESSSSVVASDAGDWAPPSEAVDAALAAALTAANAAVRLFLDDDDNGGDELLVTTRPSPPDACGRIGVFDADPPNDEDRSRLCRC